MFLPVDFVMIFDVSLPFYMVDSGSDDDDNEGMLQTFDSEDIRYDNAAERALLPSNTTSNESWYSLSVPTAMYQYCDDMIYPSILVSTYRLLISQRTVFTVTRDDPL
jgi:hypothetical protein